MAERLKAAVLKTASRQRDGGSNPSPSAITNMHPEVAALREAWRWSYDDLQPAFDGLHPDNLHRRPAPNCPAISEIAAHLAYDEAMIVMELLGKRDPSEWNIDSPLVDATYAWLPDILGAEVSAGLKALGPTDVYREVKRVHDLMFERTAALDLPANFKIREGDTVWATVAGRLIYCAYHAAYHIGQIYQTRALLGEATPDN